MALSGLVVACQPGRRDPGACIDPEDAAQAASLGDAATSDAASPDAVEATALSSEDLTRIEAWLEGAEPPAPGDFGPRFAALLPLLDSPDEHLRDELAFSLYESWLRGEDPAPPEARADLARRLLAAMRDDLPASPRAPLDPAGAYGRSFRVLVAATVVRADFESPALSSAQLMEFAELGARHAGREVDLRGRTEGGWLHPAAHLADLYSALVRHPALELDDAPALESAMLATLDGLYARPHGFRFTHGEDARWAVPLLFGLRGGRLRPEAVRGWVDRHWELLGRPVAMPFDAEGYAAQRNLRDLLISWLANLSLHGGDGAKGQDEPASSKTAREAPPVEPTRDFEHWLAERLRG